MYAKTNAFTILNDRYQVPLHYKRNVTKSESKLKKYLYY